MTEKVLLSTRLKMPAKINLWLEVLGKRPDGYHDLSSLMLPIAVYDELSIRLTEQDEIRIDCDHPDVPLDDRNLGWRAASSFLEHVGIRQGVAITIKKSIPVGAGLGGGSSDAAGVLLGLDQCLGTCVPTAEMHGLAHALGADVPFFLYRRPALARGIGDLLEWVDGVPAFPILCIKPPIMVSTAWVYGSLKLTPKPSSTKVDRLRGRPWSVSELLENDLETVTLDAYPRLREIKDWLLSHQALGALMSGSGPTVFGVFRDGEALQRAHREAEADWSDCWVFATHVIAEPASTG